MIVKYLSNGVWGFIDNVRQIASKDIDCYGLITKYNDDYAIEEPNFITHMEGQEFAPEVVASNKVFFMAENDVTLTNMYEDASFGNCHCQNLILGGRALDNYPASVIALYLNDHKEYDTLIFVTNQECYLMNDKGQTIERLV